MTGKKYADQYDHTRLLVAGRALERQQRTVTAQQLVLCQPLDAAASAQRINRVHGRHRFMHHAVMALNHQVRTRPSSLPGSGTQAFEISLNRTNEILQGIEELEGMLG